MVLHAASALTALPMQISAQVRCLNMKYAGMPTFIELDGLHHIVKPIDYLNFVLHVV